MSFRTRARTAGRLLFGTFLLLLPLAARLAGYEMFVFRRYDRKEAFSLTGRVRLQGDLFAQVQAPSSFPSYNDHSGPADRWTIGFQEQLVITPTTFLVGQLVAHNRGPEFTKFDWHFSLRQEVMSNLVVLFGHDSDHDADHESLLDGKHYFTNRNYFGVEVPVTGADLLVEPFLRFFLGSTRQPTRLDLTGDEISQESGVRLGARFGPSVTLSAQALVQSSAVFNLAQAWLAEVIVRFRLTGWLEATVGGTVWQDWGEDTAGVKQTFSRLSWGLAVPF